jgi:hypothetical protein
MGGISSSSSSSEQSAEAFLSQQFSGSCDITCSNIAQNVNIDIINSIVGGSVNLTQSCAVNASCMISGSSDAMSDILFKASNSANAGTAWLNADYSSSSSRQNIRQKIIQNTTEKCKMASLNQLNDITILAANSVIGGDIDIGQTGSVAGQCQLQNNLSAAATATAMASNSATSGKDKKASKKGSSWILISIVGFVVAAGLVYFVAKMYTGNRDSSMESSQISAANAARMKAGCPGGGKPILDLKGNPVWDPRTNHIVCSQPDFELPSSVTK